MLLDEVFKDALSYEIAKKGFNWQDLLKSDAGGGILR